MTEPARTNALAQASTTGHHRLAWLVVAAVAAALYFAYNGQHRLLDPDEGRYGEIPREMLESGDFVTPRLNYVKYFEKPPLLYWAVAGVMAIFGPNEWAMRGVSGIASLLTLLVTMGLATRMFSKQVGVLAGWVFATSLLPLVMARLLTTDALFSAFLTASWAAWWLACEAQRTKAKRAWCATGWVCMGLAVLTRGPVAAVLSAALVVVFLGASRQIAELRAILAWPGLAAFFAITVPWFYLVSARNPEFLHYFFVVQHFQRFLGETQEHIRPAWFFIPVAVMGMGGWALSALPALAAAGHGAIAAVRSAWRASAAERVQNASAAGQDTAMLFLVVWVLVVIGFFSASKCKLVPYILPAFPALAVLVARYVSEGGAKRSAGRIAAAATAVVLAGGAFVIARIAESQHVVPPQVVSPVAIWLRLALAASAGGLLVAAIHPRAHVLAAGIALLLCFPPMAASVPAVAKYKRVGALVTDLPQLPPQVRVAEFRCYDQSLSFYLRRRIVLIDDLDELAFGASVEPAREFFLHGEEALRHLAQHWPVLVNICPKDWPRLRAWGILHPVAANTGNLLVGNTTFFRLTGLKPWPDEAIRPGPLLLMPRRH